MIQTLPLLPSTFGQWDWTQSNGAASIDQTTLAYQTLIERGECSHFSRFVWNDIVDMTAKVLDEAGLKWDSSCGTVDDCKINQFLGILTADKFNGVALNVNRLGLFSWKWAVSSNAVGYVGRNKFHGTSTHGKNADYVYAWYIIELTKKLNWFIELLKSESKLDFSEFQRNIESNAFPHSVMSCVDDELLFSNTNDKSFESANLGQIGVIQPISDNTIHSYNDCILLPKQEIYHLSSDIQIASAVEVSGGRILVCSIPHRSTTSNAIANATLSKPMVTRYMGYNNQSKSVVIAVMDANILDMFSYLCSIGNYISNLASLPPTKFGSQQFSKSLVNPIFISLPTEAIFSKVKSESISFPKLYCHSILRFDAKVFSETISSSEIIIKTISPLRYALRDDTISNAVIHTPSAISMPSKTEVCANYMVYGEADKSAAMKYIEQSKFVIIDDMAACSAPTLKSTKHIQAKFDGKCVSAIAKPCVATLYVNGYDNSSDLSQCVPIKVVSHDIAYSYSDALIQSGVPLVIDSVNESISDVNGLIVNVPKQILEAKEISVDKHIAAMCHRSPEVYSALSTSHASISASMELEYNTPDIWYDPIQTDNNLYIRSAHPQQQNGTNIHLGINNTE